MATNYTPMEERMARDDLSLAFAMARTRRAEGPVRVEATLDVKAPPSPPVYLVQQGYHPLLIALLALWALLAVLALGYLGWRPLEERLASVEAKALALDSSNRALAAELKARGTENQGASRIQTLSLGSVQALPAATATPSPKPAVPELRVTGEPQGVLVGFEPADAYVLRFPMNTSGPIPWDGFEVTVHVSPEECELYPGGWPKGQYLVETNRSDRKVFISEGDLIRIGWRPAVYLTFRQGKPLWLRQVSSEDAPPYATVWLSPFVDGFGPWEVWDENSPSAYKLEGYVYRPGKAGEWRQ